MIDSARVLQNPFYLLEAATKANPGSAALITSKLELNFFELYENVRNLAFWLRSKGVKPGDILGISVPKEVFPVVTLAAMHEAAVVCITSPDNKQLGKIGCKTLVTTSSNLTVPGLRVLQLDLGVLLSSSSSSLAEFAPKHFDSEASLCKLSFSSGTTGDPKAVPISIGSLWERVLNQLQSMERGNPHLITLGLDAAINDLLLSLALEEPLLLSSGMRDALNLIAEKKVESIQSSPAQLSELLKLARETEAKLSLRLIFVTGGQIPPHLAQDLIEQFGVSVHSRFGSTETGGIALKRGVQVDSDLLGVLPPGVEAKVVSETFEEISNGSTGMLAVRSKGMVTGYYKDQKFSEKFFRDGWFLTGDLAYLDSEGALHLAGRSSEVINAGGIKVDPQKIDNFCTGRLGMDDAAAFIANSSRDAPVVGLAIVVSDRPDLQSLVQSLQAEFGAAAPTVVIRVEQIPRNELGKPMRRLLSERFSR